MMRTMRKVLWRPYEDIRPPAPPAVHNKFTVDRQLLTGQGSRGVRHVRLLRSTALHTRLRLALLLFRLLYGVVCSLRSARGSDR